MSVEYLQCCNTYIDLDYNCEGVFYYENQAYCYEHLLDYLVNGLGMTEEKADQFIDN